MFWFNLGGFGSDIVPFAGVSIQLQSLVAGVNTSSAVVQADGMLKGFGVCGRIRTILWPGVYKWIKYFRCRGREYNAQEDAGPGEYDRRRDDEYGSDKICWSLSAVESLNDSRKVEVLGGLLNLVFSGVFPRVSISACVSLADLRLLRIHILFDSLRWIHDAWQLRHSFFQNLWFPTRILCVKKWVTVSGFRPISYWPPSRLSWPPIVEHKCTTIYAR